MRFVDAMINNPLFGIILCIVTYQIGILIQQKLKTPLANPLLIAIALVIIVLKTTGIKVEAFQRGGDIITMLLAPATAVLAASVYAQIHVLKKHFLPIAAGCFAGSLTSVISVYFLCRLFGLSDELVFSMMPKSVTTPIAIEISGAHGGITAITVAAVIFTGIMGAVCSPFLIKLFRVKHPVAAGVAIGTCSHAVGTSRALEIGTVEGAMSGIAIGVSGLMTVGLSLWF